MPPRFLNQGIQSWPIDTQRVGLLDIGLRRFLIAKYYVRRGTIGVRLTKAGVEPECLGIVLECLIKLISGVIGVPTIKIGIRIRGVQPNGYVKVNDRRVVVSALRESRSSVLIHASRVGRRRNDRSEDLDGGLMSP